MKSIKEWMREKGLMEQGELSRSQFGKFFDGQTFKVDPKLKIKLRRKVEDIISDFKEEGVSKIDMLKELMGVISMMVADFDTTSGSVSRVFNALKNDPSEQIAQEAK